MTTRMFTKKELDDLDIPYKCIWKEILDTTRWSHISEGVFLFEDKHWLISWSEGATEKQFEEPFEYGGTFKATEVSLQEVLVKKWMPV